MCGLTGAFWVEGGVFVAVLGAGSGGAQGGSGFEFGQRERLSVLLQRVLLQLADGGGGERTRDALVRVFTWNTQTTSETDRRYVTVLLDRFGSVFSSKQVQFSDQSVSSSSDLNFLFI